MIRLCKLLIASRMVVFVITLLVRTYYLYEKYRFCSSNTIPSGIYIYSISTHPESVLEKVGILTSSPPRRTRPSDVISK